MKRKKEKAPAFDDIIFRDRNKEYGAYDLRRRYASTMSISLVAGLMLGSSFFLIPYFAADHTAVQPGMRIDIIAMPDADLINPPIPPEAPPPPRAPAETMDNVRFVPPVVVVDDRATGDGVLPADILNQNITDGTAVEDVPVDVIWDDPIIPAEPEPYVVVQEMPSFPGGKEALLRYISETVVYPEDAIQNRIQGTVLLRFVVSSTGEVTRVEVIRSVDPLIDSEAVRVISSLPRWKPGRQDGNPVPVWFSVPVVFVLR